MVKRILATLLNRKTFLRGSAVLAFASLLSNLLGLLRDRLLAQSFGASHALDAYNAGFIIPNLLLNIFVAGALTAAFVPIFTSLVSKEKTEEATEFTNSVLNSSILVILITGIIAFIFAPQLSRLVVPGFEPASRDLFIKMTRLLLLSPLIFAISNTIGSIQVSEQRFFWYGMSSAIYNLGIIGGTVFLGSKYGVYGAAAGAIIGAVLHLASRLIDLGHHYLRYRPEIKFSENFKKYLRLMIPKMMSQPIEQFMFLGFTAIASGISAGSIVVLNLANNFQTVPVSILGITFALTAFPVLSRMAAENNKDGFRKEMGFTILAMLITIIPISLFMFFLRRPIIAILLGGGAFDRNAIELTAATLGVFTLSITTESINHLLARAFYSLKNSTKPTLIALGGLGITLITGYFFVKTMGVKGLAVGFFCGSVFKLISHLLLLGTQQERSFEKTVI